ncbi:MAG: hypothetical protein AB1598_04940 [Thermodesulfobacteriota bacterium]
MTTSDKISLGIGLLTLGAFVLAYCHLRQSKKAANLDRAYQLIDRYFTYYANLETGPGGVLPLEQFLSKERPSWTLWAKNRIEERGFFRRLAKYWVQNSIDKETIHDQMGIIIISRFHSIADDMKSSIGTVSPLMAEWGTMVRELESFKSRFDFLKWLYRDVYGRIDY